jgi:RNA polymerase sigma-70 factor, ECF subfamily
MHASTREPTVSEEILVDHARRGAHWAFEILVVCYQDRLYRLAMRMSRNASDAEEIVQETFLRAHARIDSFRGRCRFGTWLYRIAVNEALMRRRAAGRRPTQPLHVVGSRSEEGGDALALDADGWASAEELLERKRRTRLVRDALNELDESSRAALVLRDLEELSAEEAAEILQTSPEVVRQRAHRARLKLRASLFPQSG